MRSFVTVLLFPAVLFAQTADEKKATLKFIDSLRDPDTGAWAVSPPKEGEKLKPSLRAVNGAVNALRCFGGELTEKEKVQKFVMGCYDEKTGAFAEPGDKPTVAMTSVGVLAATAVGIDKAKYKKAMGYIEENAMGFEDYRIGAAAIEAFGVKESGIDAGVWVRLAYWASFKLPPSSGYFPSRDYRATVSFAALCLRLDQKLAKQEREEAVRVIWDKQQKDGGWQYSIRTSDAETTYRVMRALMLLKEKPKDPEAVAKFVASCRRKDGGYGVDADAPSSMSGVYYAAKVSEWLR
jgi:hypothetical protein